MSSQDYIENYSSENRLLLTETTRLATSGGSGGSRDITVVLADRLTGKLVSY